MEKHEVVADAMQRFHLPGIEDGHLLPRHGNWKDSLALTHCLCYEAAWQMLNHLLDNPELYESLRPTEAGT